MIDKKNISDLLNSLEQVDYQIDRAILIITSTDPKINQPHVHEWRENYLQERIKIQHDLLQLQEVILSEPDLDYICMCEEYP